MTDLGLTDIASLVQTIAIIVALLLTVYFSRRQIQAYAVDLETRVLNDLDEKFHRIAEIGIARPELIHTIYHTPDNVTSDVPFAYYVTFFCAHIFHMRERGILQDNEWAGWLGWMKKAFREGTIGATWREADMGAWFDPAFTAFVNRELVVPVPRAS
jgi:hypothetical protein